MVKHLFHQKKPTRAKELMPHFFQYLLILLIGGSAYALLETLWRGYTHWTMGLTGAAAFFMIYLVYTLAPSLPLVVRAAFSAALVTALEFAVGAAVNLSLHWNVWDYSALPLNVCGQICPLYSLLWFFLSFPAFGICELLKRYVFV